MTMLGGIARPRRVFAHYSTRATSQGPLLKLVLQHCGYAAALLAVTVFFVLMGALAGVAYVFFDFSQLSQSVQDQPGLETER